MLLAGGGGTQAIVIKKQKHATKKKSVSIKNVEKKTQHVKKGQGKKGIPLNTKRSTMSGNQGHICIEVSILTVLVFTDRLSRRKGKQGQDAAHLILVDELIEDVSRLLVALSPLREEPGYRVEHPTTVGL